MRDRLIELLDKEILSLSLVDCDYVWTRNIIGELADRLLAEGVIVPPCKVGDTIYKPIITSRGKPAIWEIIVTNISIFIEKNGVSPASYVIGHLKRTRCGESADFCEFGKTVFLTREEAKKTLERRENATS
ncbi:MAG: hypothetical protein IJE25_08245 [Clostridia bacterium]|nr:hypothetical protein [Clostridia bacterium]